MLCGGPAVTALHEGMEADLQFIQLAFESTGASLDRYRAGIIGAVLVWAALARPSTPDSALAPVRNGDGMPSASPSPTKASRERPKERADHVRDQITGWVLPESHPVAVSIPKLGVRSPLDDLGLDTDGAMEVPENPARAGWFSGGPARRSQTQVPGQCRRLRQAGSGARAWRLTADALSP